MLKRSHRDLDLPSLVPPQFIAASEAKRSKVSMADTTVRASDARGKPPYVGRPPENSRAAWDAALLNAYIVESEMPSGPTAGLGMGMGFEVVNPEPKWNGSWSSHGSYMRFLFGREEKTEDKTSNQSVTTDDGLSKEQYSSSEALLKNRRHPLKKKAKTMTDDVDIEDDDDLDDIIDDDDDDRTLSRRRLRNNEDDESDVSLIDADADDWITTDKAITVGAREFAERTKLRRGFFAKALKRQLEDLQEENSRLKKIATQVFDHRERRKVFADLGTESATCVAGDYVDEVTAKGSGSFYAAKTRPSSTFDIAKLLGGSSPSIVDDEATEAARRALDSVVETTNRVVREVDRRDLTLVKVVQQAQRAFVITNPALPDNPIVWSSDEFSKLTGYERHEICGRNCRFLQGPLTNPKSVFAVRKAIDESHEASVILLNYRKDGSTFWNRFFIAPLRDSKGKVVFYVGVQTDVTSTVARSLKIGAEPVLDDTDAVGTSLRDAANTLIHGSSYAAGGTTNKNHH